MKGLVFESLGDQGNAEALITVDGATGVTFFTLSYSFWFSGKRLIQQVVSKQGCRFEFPKLMLGLIVDLQCQHLSFDLGECNWLRTNRLIRVGF